MKEATLIFPDQLFLEHPGVSHGRPIYIAEEFLFFRVQAFHKQKLVLLRASMNAYAEKLIEKGYQVKYINSSELKNRGDLFKFLHGEKIERLHLADFSDDWLKEDLKKAVSSFSLKVELYNTPMFMCSEEEIRTFFKSEKKFSMSKFYAFQRRRLNILMENGKPLGGKFSFDSENRKRLPKKLIPPAPYQPRQTTGIQKFIDAIENEFPNAIGESKPFLYPTTHAEAEKALFDFIEHRLMYFGDYEDAISETQPYIFHSILSPLLNIGLLTPTQVIEAALSSYKKLGIPLNSLEGFIRQIIGWREFMRACYLLNGKSMRTSNFFKHKSAFPKGFWEGNTGIVPVDMTIKKVLKSGYCHHIERLMILGNFMLLTKCHPIAIYEWFMANFIDSYDWVMVPNVYAMSQYADHGSITTKPYISGANYILKMSDYKKGEWCDIWDGLFWRFLAKHRPLFEQNSRTKVLTTLLDKNAFTIDPKIKLANAWMQKHRDSFY